MNENLKMDLNNTDTMMMAMMMMHQHARGKLLC